MIGTLIILYLIIAIAVGAVIFKYWDDTLDLDDGGFLAVVIAAVLWVLIIPAYGLYKILSRKIDKYKLKQEKEKEKEQRAEAINNL